MENATSANLHIHRDGHLGTMGLTGDKKAAVVRAGKWQRLVVAVELEKQKFCAYVNGKPAIEIVKNDKLVSNGRFALDTEFYLFSGMSCAVSVRCQVSSLHSLLSELILRCSDSNEKFCQAIKVSTFIVRGFAMAEDAVRTLGSPTTPVGMFLECAGCGMSLAGHGHSMY